MSAINICRVMHWRYEWVDALPRAVYDILVDELNRPPEPE